MKMCFYHPSRHVSDEERASIEAWGYTLEADEDCPRQFMYFMSKDDSGGPCVAHEEVVDAT